MSPTEYVLLRRLKKIRRVLRDGNPNMMNGAEVARGSALRVGALRRDLPG